MKRSYIILVIMLALAVALFAIGVLIVRHRIQQTVDMTDSQSGQAPADTTANPSQNTYTNTQFGFELNYPPSFSDPTNINLTATPATPTSDYFTLDSKDSGSIVVNAKPLAPDEINLSLADLVSRHSANVASQTTTSLGNESALQVNFTTQGTISLGGVRTDVTNENVIFVRHNDTLIWVELRPNPADTTNGLNTVLNSWVFTSPDTSAAPSDTPSTDAGSNPDTTANPSPDTVTNTSAVQSFSITADDYSATPSEITVPAGTIVDLTFTVSPANVSFGGLDFHSPVINTGAILPGSSKTIAFTATSSFVFTPYEAASNVEANYMINVTVQ